MDTIQLTCALLVLFSIMTSAEGNACASVPKHRLFGPVINICERNTTTVDGFIYFSGSSAEMGSMTRCNCSIVALTQKATLSSVVSAVTLPQFTRCNATLRIQGSREQTLTCQELYNFYLEMNTTVVTVEVDRHVVDDFDFCFYMTAKDFSRSVNYSVTCENYGGQRSLPLTPPPESTASLTMASLTTTNSLTTGSLTPTTSLTTASFTPTTSLATASFTPTTSLTTASFTPTTSLTTASFTPTIPMMTTSTTPTVSLATSSSTPASPMATTTLTPVVTPDGKTALTSGEHSLVDAPPSGTGTRGGGRAEATACPCDCGLSSVSDRKSGDFPFVAVVLAVLGWVIAIDATLALLLLCVRRRKRRRARSPEQGADNPAYISLSELTGASFRADPCYTVMENKMH